MAPGLQRIVRLISFADEERTRPASRYRHILRDEFSPCSQSRCSPMANYLERSVARRRRSLIAAVPANICERRWRRAA